MSEEQKKFAYSSLPDEAKKLASTDAGRGVMAFFSKKPEALQAAISLGELHKKAAEVIRLNPQMQESIHHLAEIVQKNRQIMQPLLDAQKAAGRAANSRTVRDFKKNAAQVQDFQKKFNFPVWEYSEHITSCKRDDVPVPECARADAVVQIDYLEQVIKTIFGVTFAVREFLDEFKESVERNEETSKKWWWASILLSVVAIFVALYGVCNDKTGKLIKVVENAHPWVEQPAIAPEDAKHLSVAFHAITSAIQEHIRNKKEIDRLHVDLGEMQNRLTDIQKKHDSLTLTSRQERIKLQQEIDDIKSQIEKQKVELTRKTIPASASHTENK